MFGQLNESLKDALAQLEASKGAADNAWVTLQDSRTTHSRRCGPASTVRGRR